MAIEFDLTFIFMLAFCRNSECWSESLLYLIYLCHFTYLLQQNFISIKVKNQMKGDEEGQEWGLVVLWRVLT